MHTVHRSDGWRAGPWDDWVAASELHRPTYAERIHPEQLLRTRANTWSNLVSSLVGFYACGRNDFARGYSP